jgi:voltage-gated potassium channel Kch
MSAAPTLLLTVLGASLILVVLRDAFEALFHPDGRRVLSRGIIRVSWRLFHRIARRRPRAFALAGPVTLLAILISWMALLILGWALIIWPHLPDGFHFASELGRPGGGFSEAIYLSIVTLATIGYGDISPASDLMRLIVPLEALIGLGLLTAAVSWLLSVYPALSRRRSLAYEITLLREVLANAERFPSREPASAEQIYGELLSRLVAVERDLVTIPISYYFSGRDDRFSLPVVMPWLLDLADAGLDDSLPAGTRLRAQMLRAAIDDFARTTAERFHGRRSSSTAELLAHYAADHLRNGGSSSQACGISTDEAPPGAPSVDPGG